MSEKAKEGFTLGLALLDAVPVLAFGINMIILSKPLNSTLFLAGAIIAFLAGGSMVFYKLSLALAKKDFPVCKKIMRIGMMTGWIIMIAALIVNRKNISMPGIWSAVTGMPSVIFFILGILCFIAFLTYFKTKFKAESAKDNWVEECLNAGVQVFFMLGIILAV